SGVTFSYIPTSNTAGATFSWTRAAVAGISNPAASGNGNISETLVNTTSSSVTVTYLITTQANGCVNTQSVQVTVRPATNITCTMAGSITSNFTNTAIPAGRYIWFNSVWTGVVSLVYQVPLISM